MKTLLVVLLISMAVTAQAGKLSQLAAKVAHPLQKMVVIACATGCMLGFAPKHAESIERVSPIKELVLGVAPETSQGFIRAKFGIPTDGEGEGDFSLFNIDTNIMASYRALEDNVHAEHFDAHFIRMSGIASASQSYAHANRLEYAITGAGYDFYDKDSYDLTDGTEGFKASHLHWMGFESPFVIMKVGVGHLPGIKTGEFEQADLEAWAGDAAEFFYWLFVTNGVGFDLQSPQLPVSFGAKILQSRTLWGGIDFADGTDGNFTAIWEIIEADAELSFLNVSSSFHADFRIGVIGSVFRQRISGNTETGEKFSQRVNGARIRGFAAFYFH